MEDLLAFLRVPVQNAILRKHYYSHLTFVESVRMMNRDCASTLFGEYVPYEF